MAEVLREPRHPGVTNILQLTAQGECLVNRFVEAMGEKGQIWVQSGLYCGILWCWRITEAF